MDPLDPRFEKISDYVDGLLSDGERQEVEQLLEQDLEAMECFEQMQEQLSTADDVLEVTPLQRELTQKVLSRLDQRKKLQGGAATVAAVAMAVVGVFSISPAGDAPQSLAFKPAKPRMLDMVARSYLLTDRSPVDPYEILLSPEREAEADLRNK
jgi:anti-sigma factor RsiW